MTQIDNKPSLRPEPKFLAPAWTVMLNGGECGTVVQTGLGFAASRDTTDGMEFRGYHRTKIKAMHAVLGRGVKP